MRPGARTAIAPQKVPPLKAQLCKELLPDDCLRHGSQGAHGHIQHVALGRLIREGLAELSRRWEVFPE